MGALAVSGAVAGASYELLRRSLFEERERTAVRAALFDAAVVQAGLEAVDPQLVDVLRALDTGSARTPVVRRDGQWFARSVDAGVTETIPVALQAAVEDGRPAAQRVEVDGELLQVVGVPLPSVGAGYYEVGSLTELEDTLGLLGLTLALVAAGTTVAGAGLGALASRRLVRPLGEVTRAARVVAGGDLTARLDSRADPDLAELTDAFNQMIDELGRRLDRDRRFAGDVSHELRSPLQTLAAATSVLERRADGLDERSQRAVGLLSDEVARFEALVTDLLALAAGEQAADLAPVDLAALVRGVVARSGAPAGVLDLPAGPLPAAVDPRRYEQAVVNLLDNAAAYGGGVVRVGLRARPGELVLEVDDAGPGVLLEERGLVFDRFARGRAAHARGGGAGTGLGLSLVAQHAAAHGGRADVLDRPGGGARFVIVVPAP